jgi:signal transduction histidine kinase
VPLGDGYDRGFGGSAGDFAGTPSGDPVQGRTGPALRTLARRCTVPVDLDLHVDQRLPDTVEVGAYYVVAEALTNAAKYARASVVEVCAQATNSHLRLEIRDDGIGLKSGSRSGRGPRGAS